MKPSHLLSAPVPAQFVVAHNTVEGDDEAEEPPSLAADAEVEEVAHAVVAALSAGGVDAALLPVRSLGPALAELEGGGATHVFNLVEGIGGDACGEPDFAQALEAARLPYTGNGPEVLTVALHKDLTRRLLAAFRIPVPEGRVIHSLADLAAGPLPPWPLFVKPAAADGSIGVDQGSVVADRRSLRARVDRLLSAFDGPVLVEAYLPGPEVNVAVVPRPGGTVLLPTVIDFSRNPRDLWPIVSYDCKWVEGSAEYQAFSRPAAEVLPEAMIDRAVDVAGAACLAVGLQSSGRIDLRFSADGWPRVIDVNPNCDLPPEAGLALAARAAGIDYTDLILGVAADAALKARHVHPSLGRRRPRPARGAAHAGSELSTR